MPLQIGSSAQVKSPASPCTNVCQIARATGLCIGCKRTLDEISAWPNMTADQRRALLNQLKMRA